MCLNKANKKRQEKADNADDGQKDKDMTREI